ncbi:cytochrome P450 [Gordonia neofelifaecis NRRL B-59395]|uniref:Cytochrome P450 n=2 Tax=Gordonia TaxID=2053 RepID=F1YFR6_9ACTN|nr:cytochrome P450 [Gordonia neofelifaecis]EGD56493.1 cytochrome P450 [Gordonia neofelifaecis NRRL B-59395]
MSPEFTLRSGSTWRDPFGMYAQLRAYDPVHHVVPERDPSSDYYVLSRHADVMAAARDWETFSSAQGLTVAYGELEKIGLQANPPMVMQDPPAHTDFRRLVARGFTPRQVTTLEPKVRQFVVERLEDLVARGSGDIAAELFKPLPSMVVAHYLGVPDSDRSQFDGWTDAIVAANPGADLSAAATTAADAVVGLMAYFSELIEYRRRNPGDDTVSHLVAAGVADDPEGNPGGVLSVLAFAFTMVAGGNDTTTGMLGGSSALLTVERDQREILLREPELLAVAVNELLRLTSPVQGLTRTTTRDVEIEGVTVPAGRKVLLCYASANRDERMYGEDADRLDVRRDPANILTFSHGSHHCLGAAAARMQARVALEELLARCPGFEVDVDGIEWATGNYVRRPVSVPFSV